MKDEGDDGVWRERAGILVDHLVTVKKLNGLCSQFRVNAWAQGGGN
jgi:hypothetical protein